ncbi:hypothetical protein HWV62_23801 [Athelia sp. TMB]|nr:hypothetical protein HWV62_23801 [Athelia sp. TMB]
MRHGQPQQPAMNGALGQPGARPTRPTTEQLAQAQQFATQIRNKFVKNNLPNMTQHNVLDADRVEYNRVLEQAFHASQEMDPKLPKFFEVLKDATASSPKTPKSPKFKLAAKPKPAPAQKSRKGSKVVAPTPEPVQAPSPSSSLKRPREDEETAAGTPVVSSAPSPKKAKTEWEAPPCEEVIKKEQQIDNIKTDEDANAFLQQMTELLQMAAGNDGQEMTNITETLDMILKGCGQETSDLGASGSGFIPDMGASDASAPNADEFQDYFDFTTCAPDEDSKPATPDLLSSSSTNPSPESASDPADPATAAGDNRHANLKVEQSYEPDSLRLGAWQEVISLMQRRAVGA